MKGAVRTEYSVQLKGKYIGNTMLVSFDIKFIRRDQKQRRNGEACLASSACVWQRLIT